jgi:LacI family transcriptional regulator
MPAGSRPTYQLLGVIVGLSKPLLPLASRASNEPPYRGIRLVCNTDENREREKNALRLLLRQKVAGLVAATTFGDSDALASYAGLDRPVVFFDNIPPVHVQINCVTIDNVQAARELTQYMIGLGHRRILMISGPAENSRPTSGSWLASRLQERRRSRANGSPTRFPRGIGARIMSRP